MKKLSEWKELRNKFSGSVFVFLSGPSAKSFPVEKYSNYPFIAVNGSVSRLVELGVDPFFYIGTDIEAIKGAGDIAVSGLNNSCYSAFSVEVYKDFFSKYKSKVDEGKLDEAFKLEKATRINRGKSESIKRFAFRNILDKELKYRFSLFSNNKNRVGFSSNMGKGYYCARTIAYVAIQLAKHLGFNKVFIVGLDLTSENRFYEEGEVSALSTLDINYERFILPSFKLLSEKVVDNSFSVFNLSENSRLPNNLISKISFLELDNMLSE